MLYKYLIYTINNDIYKITVKCYQNFQFSKVIRCLPVKTDGYRSVNSDYRSINNGYRFFEFELSFRAVSSGFRRFTAGLPIPLVGENRFTVGKVNPVCMWERGPFIMSAKWGWGCRKKVTWGKSRTWVAICARRPPCHPHCFCCFCLRGGTSCLLFVIMWFSGCLYRYLNRVTIKVFYLCWASCGTIRVVGARTID